MAKRAEGKTLGCPKLTLIEKLTRGLLQGNDEESTFVVKDRRVFLATSVLRKDSFVMEYTGDIISAEEATIRIQNYGSCSKNYSILYFTYQEMNLAMDASQNESFARFIAHSPNPNIRFYRPFIADLNSVLPKIAAYALRDIQQGEEIVVDYRMQDSHYEDAETGTGDDAPETSELESTISIVGNFCSQPPVCNGFSSAHTKGCFSTEGNMLKSKRQIAVTGVCGYDIRNFAPKGFKKSYVAIYQTIGKPSKIIPLPDCLLAKKQLHWLKNMCNDDSDELGNLTGIPSTTHIFNLSDSLYACPSSSIVLPSKKDPTNFNFNKKHKYKNLPPSFNTSGRSTASVSKPWCGKKTKMGSSQIKLRRLSQEILSNSWYDSDQRDNNIIDSQAGDVSTDLAPYVHLMDREWSVLVNRLPESDLEKASLFLPRGGCKNWRKRILAVQSENIASDLQPCVSLMAGEGSVLVERSSVSDLDNFSPYVACSGVRNCGKIILDDVKADNFIMSGRNESLKDNSILKESNPKFSQKCEVVLSKIANSLTPGGLTRNMLNHVAMKYASASGAPVAVVKGIVSTEISLHPNSSGKVD